MLFLINKLCALKKSFLTSTCKMEIVQEPSRIKNQRLRTKNIQGSVPLKDNASAMLET